jgi:hypothetical protein
MEKVRVQDKNGISDFAAIPADPPCVGRRDNAPVPQPFRTEGALGTCNTNRLVKLENLDYFGPHLVQTTYWEAKCRNAAETGTF